VLEFQEFFFTSTLMRLERRGPISSNAQSFCWKTEFEAWNASVVESMDEKANAETSVCLNVVDGGASNRLARRGRSS